jgi:hypothetical protein
MLSALPILIAAATAATAGGEGPRHRGFFLRMDLGFGYSSSWAGGTTLSGASSAIGLGIGGNIDDNLALFGELFGSGVSRPEMNGQSSSIDSVAIGGLGAGLTYYLMPANVFFSGVLGIGSMTQRLGGVDNDTRAGLVARFGTGKEWFVSESWGLGIAAYLNVAVQRDYTDRTWRTLAPIVAFSATFY